MVMEILLEIILDFAEDIFDIVLLRRGKNKKDDAFLANLEEDRMHLLYPKDESNSNKSGVSLEKKTIKPNEWYCTKCNTLNKKYVGTCKCGNKKELLK